jgi:hypothetical protein
LWLKRWPVSPAHFDTVDHACREFIQLAYEPADFVTQPEVLETDFGPEHLVGIEFISRRANGGGMRTGSPSFTQRP